MRIATWNVNSIRARTERVGWWLDEHQPDVIAVQETRCTPAQVPGALFADRGYQVVAHGVGSRGGVALASRVGLVDVTLGIPGAVHPLDLPVSISATCGDLRIHTAYAPNGRKVGTEPHRVKLAWFALFAAWMTIDGVTDRPTVVAGDLNIAPTDLDVWDPARYRKRNLTSRPERDAFAALLETGLVDVVRAHHGDTRLSSWWNRRGDFYESDRGWRLDHILTDPTTAKRVRTAVIDRRERGVARSSDHAPCYIDIDPAEAGVSSAR